MIISSFTFESSDDMLDFKKQIEETLNIYKKKRNGVLYSTSIEVTEDDKYKLCFGVTNEVQNN